MNSRWLLLGFGLVFAVTTLWAVDRANYLIAGIAFVHAVFGLGGFWWNSTHESTVETRFSRS